MLAQRPQRRHGLRHRGYATKTRALELRNESIMTDTNDATNSRTDAARTAKRGSPWANVALFAFSAALTVLVIEVGFRLAMGLPMLEFPNWRIDNTVILNGRDVIIPDPKMGWTLRPGNSSPGHHTIDHGIRRNAAGAMIRQGAILAVGDSFTEGWEVEDEETWPAYLERKTGKPILNAGIGGYGTDQIVLRAEQLLPVLRPKILIVGFLEFDILRAGHTHFGSPKPYFTIENGALKLHPPALLPPRRERGFFVGAGYRARDVLGHLAAVDFLLGRLTPDFWYGSEKRQYTRAPNDPVRVTCALLERLKKRTDADGVRLLLFMQYYAESILDDDVQTDNAQGVIACAKTLGIELVDQFLSLRDLVEADREAIRPLYNHDGKNFTHMSARGNEHAAGLLAKVLGE